MGIALSDPSKSNMDSPGINSNRNKSSSPVGIDPWIITSDFETFTEERCAEKSLSKYSEIASLSSRSFCKKPSRSFAASSSLAFRALNRIFLILILTPEFPPKSNRSKSPFTPQSNLSICSFTSTENVSQSWVLFNAMSFTDRDSEVGGEKYSCKEKSAVLVYSKDRKSVV